MNHRTIAVTMAGLSLVLTSGCVVDQYGRVWLVPPPVVVAPPSPVVIAPPPSTLLQRAERGNAVAQFTLGSCYASGNGAPQNYQEAVRWFYLSARQGYAPAQNRLGICCYRGLGTPQNYADAVQWYRKAAAQGYAPAEDNLGICYFSGRGVAQDSVAAARWYRLAAAQGNQAAAAHLRQVQGPAGGSPAAYRQPAPSSPPPTSPATMSAASPEPAEPPLTVDQIKEASKAGVKADTLTDEIKSTNSKFSPQEIAEAQQASVDPAVIECMKESSR